MNAPSSRTAATAEIAAFFAAWFGVSLLEAALLTADSRASGALVLWASWRVALHWTLILAAPVWIFSAAIGVAAFTLPMLPPAGESGKRRVHVAAMMLAGAALAIWIHLTLGSYAEFRWYPPFLVASIVIAAVLGLGHAGVPAPGRVASPSRRLLAATWLVVGFGGFLAIHLANRMLFVRQYPTLHLGALLWACALLQLAFFKACTDLLGRGKRRTVVVPLAVLAALAVSTALVPRWMVDEATGTMNDSNILGEARLVGLSYDPKAEDVLAGPVASEPEAEALFSRMSHLPSLPPGFRLEDHNVLLITSEATRYDQTSLGDPRLGTTPNLASFAAGRDTFSFGRAFAASSGTLHSISALLCMTFPSMIALETWGKAWHGVLHQEEETVPELFARAGYDTFLVSYDHKRAFQETITGLDQGFASRKYIHEDGTGPESALTDIHVADGAIAEIRKRADGNRRFFGWVFLSSPHGGYLAHYPDMPRDTDLDRYRQEIRHMDVQLGRILSGLREAGLQDRTVVVFTGDHGEEFREHGGTHHKSTVYSESTWVPLVVRLPGAGGGRIDAPTSLVYLFPWLAMAGPKPLREAAKARLEEDIGPMMRATHGAVVIELVGHDRMRSSLVLDSSKTNYDLISGRIELFDTRRDPGEQRDLLGDHPDLEAGARAAVDSYRRIRAARRRYLLVPGNDR